MAKPKIIPLKKISFDITENDREKVREWILTQSDLIVAIKYLIEKEVVTQGSVVDASTYIPLKITDATFTSITTIEASPKPILKDIVLPKPVHVVKPEPVQEVSDDTFDLYKSMT